MKYRCRTQFDITRTGITGHYRPSTGMTLEQWTQARNQQRNWETLLQIISLRTQMFDITEPVHDNGVWTFEFRVETPSVFGAADDPTKLLRKDADSVPMLSGRDPVCLITQGPDQNIWFEQIAINTSEEQNHGRTH